MRFSSSILSILLLLLLQYITAKHKQDCGADAIASNDLKSAAETLNQYTNSGCKSPAEYYNNLAFVKRAEGRSNAAVVRLLFQAIQSSPSHAGSYSNLANALRSEPGEEEKEAALLHASTAVTLDPASPTYRFGLGAAQHELGALHEALATYQTILGLERALSSRLRARCNKMIGMALGELGRPREAMRHLEAAVVQTSREHSSSSSSNGNDEAEAGCRLALTRRQTLQWRHHRADLRHVREAVERGGSLQRCLEPAQALLFPLPMNIILSVAEQTAARVVSRDPRRGTTRGCAGVARQGGPLRVAYATADARDHTTGHLLREILAAASPTTTSAIFIYGTPPPEEDPWTASLRQQPGSSLRYLPDPSRHAVLSEALLQQGCTHHALIDLNGYSPGGRPAVVSHPGIGAPTASALEFSSTMAGVVHYSVADGVSVPPCVAGREFKKEKTVTLPHMIFPASAVARAAAGPTASDRMIPPEVLPGVRRLLGVAADAPLLACFNELIKIGPDSFTCLWANSLRRIDGARIWLQLPGGAKDTGVDEQLRRELAGVGLLPSRMVLSARAARAVHHRIKAEADLFLDTAPYGAHITAADSLWAGVPIVTIPGERMASRIAQALLVASRLGASHCGAWAPSTRKGYEDFAVALLAG